MSLVGNLEDLGLGDILQIVSLSRKSGELVLHSQNREGKIIFKNGHVIRATSSVFRENLGDLLIRRGIIDVEQIKSAVQLQRTITPPPRIGTILSEQFGVSKEIIDTLVKEQIEKIVYSFFAWHEGTFAFDLGDSGEVETTSFDPLQFMLDQGLSPQWLAMEGSRIIDEKRHRGETIEDVGEEPILDVSTMFELYPAETPTNEEQASDQAALPALILVDDDDVTRDIFAKELGKRGFLVSSCAAARDFLEQIEIACTRGSEPLLLIDLLMPRQDGSGILGGLELIERIRIEYPGLNVFVLSDHPNDEAQRQVSSLGLPNILKKPTRIDVRSQSGVAQIADLADYIRSAFQAVSFADDQNGTFNLGAELRMEFGEGPEAVEDKGPETPGLYMLRGMLQELNNPALGGGIILLVLRFASELMNRAVIFLVKDEEIVGLGQFGIESLGGVSADIRVRRMRIPRNAGSVLDQVLQDLSPVKTVTDNNSQWDQYLVNELGAGVAQEIFLGPIISEGKIVAILYGDNAPRKRQIGDTESLEIFLSQAGLAMEKALLERRLRSKETSLQ